MIQSYQNLDSQVNIVENSFNGQVFIQKIYSSSRYICINLRAVGKTSYLYIGRGHGYEGVWLGETQLESALRKRDVFLEYLRKHISGSTFLGIELDSKDRIISLKYQKWGHENRLNIFYRGRDLLFSNLYYCSQKKRVRTLVSWDKRERDIDRFEYSVFEEVGRDDIKKDFSKKIVSIDKLLEQEKEKLDSLGENKKKKKFIKRKRARILADLDKVLKRDLILDYIDSHLDLGECERKVSIGPFKITFKEKSHFKRRDQLFNKIKSLKKAHGILEDRLSQTKDLVSEVVQNDLKMIKVFWRDLESNKKTVEKKVTNDSDYYAYEDLKIAVGKSSQGNDYIRSKWGKKEDYWFHIMGDKSAHIIVKGNFLSLGLNFFEIIASILVDYSNMSYTEVDLMYTQVKNLKGVKNSPGKVIYKKERYIKVRCDLNWRDMFSSSSSN